MSSAFSNYATAAPKNLLDPLIAAPEQRQQRRDGGGGVTGGTAATAAAAKTARKARGPAIISLAAFTCSFVALGIKLMTDRTLPSALITLVSSALSLVVTAAAMLWLATRGGGVHHSIAAALSPRRHELRLLLLRGALGAVAIGCFYASLDALPLDVSVSLFFSSPLFAVALEAASTRRAPSRAALIGCALTAGGVALTGWRSCSLGALTRWLSDHGGGALILAPCDAAAAVANNNPFVSDAPPATTSDLVVGGALAITGAAANAAAFVVVSALGRAGVGAMQVTLWYHAVVTALSAAALTLPPLVLSRGASAGVSTALRALARLSSHDWAMLGLVSGANAAGQLLLNAGFEHTSPGRGAAINSAQVLWSCVWSALILHAPPRACSLAGAAAIMAGVAAVAVRGRTWRGGAEAVAEAGRRATRTASMLITPVLASAASHILPAAHALSPAAAPASAPHAAAAAV